MDEICPFYPTSNTSFYARKRCFPNSSISSFFFLRRDPVRQPKQAGASSSIDWYLIFRYTGLYSYLRKAGALEVNSSAGNMAFGKSREMVPKKRKK